MALDLREFRREPARVASLLQWDTLDDTVPWLLWQRNGTLLAVLTFRGQDLDSAEDPILVAQAQQLNQIVRRFGGGWGLMSEARHEAVTTYPESVWPDPVSAAVDAERRAYFTTPGQHYETRTWLTLTWKMPPPTTVSWLQRVLYEHLPATSDEQSWAVESFVDECLRTRDLLRGCLHDVAFLEGSDLLTYLHQCISAKRHQVRVPEPACYLNTYLSDMDVHISLSEVILGPVEAPDALIACISPVPQYGQPAYPNQTYPGLLTVLNGLPFEWRCCLRYLPFARDKAIKELSKYVKQHASAMKKGFTRAQKDASAIVEQAAVERSQEASGAQALVEHGHASVGPLTLTVVVWDAERETLARKVREVEATLNTEGFIAKRETYNTAEAWLGTMPGNTLANVRRPLLTSANFAHLFPATAPWRGQAWNRHLEGPPVLMAVGKHGTPVGVSLHAQDVGHFGLIGSTGDGKSTFLNFECLQWRRYPGSQLAIFDKGGAARILTYLVEGAWYDMGTMPLQPLASVTTPLEIGWAVDWLSGILTQENVRVTPPIKAAIHAALQELAMGKPATRTMSNLAKLVSHRHAQHALSLYTHAGPYGLLLDGDTEEISTNPWLCFEMGSILETPSLLGSVLPALFHSLEKRLTGAPSKMVLHEGWVALDHPFWSTRLRGWLKGLRVRNGSVGLLTQSLADSVNSAIMPALLDNVATWILTPNDKAEEEEIGQYYRAIGLNARQRELIKQGTKKQDYYLLQHDGQGMLKLDLGPLALAACRTWGPAELAHYVAMYDEEPVTFARRYFAEQGVKFS